MPATQAQGQLHRVAAITTRHRLRTSLAVNPFNPCKFFGTPRELYAVGDAADDWPESDAQHKGECQQL